MRCVSYGLGVIFLLLILSEVSSAAQSVIKPQPARSFLRMSYSECIGERNSFTQPVSHRVSDDSPAAEISMNLLSEGGSSPWRRFPYVAAGTAVLWNYDEQIQVWVQERRTPTTDMIAEYAKLLGDLEFMLRPLAALHLYGAVFGDERARRTARLSAEGIMIGGVATQIIKHSVSRPRPDDEAAEDPFGLPGPVAMESFPSGHATVAFAWATVVVSEYGNSNMIRPLAYTLAGLTAWSRVNDNAHWASDVLFGSFIGYVASKTVIRYEELAGNPSSALAAASCPVSLRFAF